MASLETLYSGSMLTAVEHHTQALLPQGNALFLPSYRRAELHPGMALWEPLSRHFHRKGAWNMLTLHAHGQQDHCLQADRVAVNLYINAVLAET